VSPAAASDRFGGRSEITSQASPPAPCARRAGGSARTTVWRCSNKSTVVADDKCVRLISFIDQIITVRVPETALRRI
jgi:hypothetical protein